MARNGRELRVRTAPVRPQATGRREIRDVRHASSPALRIERVVAAPSGVHVVTEISGHPTGLPTGSRTGTRSGPRSAPPGSPPLGPRETDLERARAAADLVRSLLPGRYRARVRAVLCHCDENDARTTSGVLVTSPDTFDHIVQCSPVVLSTSEVHQILLRLEATLTPFPLPCPSSERRWWRRRLAVTGLLATPAAAAAALWVPEWVPEVTTRLPGW